MWGGGGGGGGGGVAHGKGVAYLFCLSRPGEIFFSRKCYIRAFLSLASEWPTHGPTTSNIKSFWSALKSPSSFDVDFRFGVIFTFLWALTRVLP